MQGGTTASRPNGGDGIAPLGAPALIRGLPAKATPSWSCHRNPSSDRCAHGVGNRVPDSGTQAAICEHNETSYEQRPEHCGSGHPCPGLPATSPKMLQPSRHAST
jgi:hypothetical protein